jgi:hypothetical protein
MLHTTYMTAYVHRFALTVDTNQRTNDERRPRTCGARRRQASIYGEANHVGVEGARANGGVCGVRQLCSVESAPSGEEQFRESDTIRGKVIALQQAAHY